MNAKNVYKIRKHAVFNSEMDKGMSILNNEWIILQV